MPINRDYDGIPELYCDACNHKSKLWPFSLFYPPVAFDDKYYDPWCHYEYMKRELADKARKFGWNQLIIDKKCYYLCPECEQKRKRKAKINRRKRRKRGVIEDG